MTFSYRNRPGYSLAAVSTMLLLCTCFMCPDTALSQSSTRIEGQIVDARTQEPLGFSYVHLEELSRSTAANIEGRFVFTNLPSGTWTLATHRIGYQTMHRRISIEAGDTVQVEIRLSPGIIESEAIEIVGVREQVLGAGLQGTTQRIHGNELRKRLSSTLGETLDALPGFSNRTNGPSAARPVIRGLGGERVILLENGQRSGDLSANSSDHAVTINAFSADEIEIARGPAALAYGANAVGGVVNVVNGLIPTDATRHITGSSTLQAYSASKMGGGALSLRGPAGELSWQLQGDFSSSGNLESPQGPIENTDYTNASASLGLSLPVTSGFSGLGITYFSNHYGIPPLEDHAEEDHDEHHNHTDGVTIEMAKWQTQWKSEYVLAHRFWRSAEGKASVTHYEHKEIESTGIVGSRYRQWTGDATLTLRHRPLFNAQEGRIGIWGEYQDFGAGGEVNTPDVKRHRVAFFGIESFRRKAWVVEAGLRGEIGTFDPTDTDAPYRSRIFRAASASVALRFEAGRAFQFGISTLRSFRPPSIEELYSEGAHLATYSIELGNENLSAERGWAQEAFIRYEGARLHGSLTGYYNYFDTYIYPLATGEMHDGLPVYLYRGSRAKIYGFESSIQWNPLTHWTLDGTISYTRGENTETERPLPLIPPVKGQTTLTYTNGRWEATLTNRWAGQQDLTGPFETDTQGYMIWDAGLQYHRSGSRLLHTVSLTATNLLNSAYRNHLSRIKEIMPEAGIGVRLLYRLYL